MFAPKKFQGEAVSRGVELVAAISAPSDEQFASTITQAQDGGFIPSYTHLQPPGTPSVLFF